MFRTAPLLALAAALLATPCPAAHAALPPPPPGPLPAPVPYACVVDAWPWGCVADCGSGGRWHAETGNGFYGGLQFWQPTWVEYGGLAHAPRADLATREQQTEVAREALAVQGWSAWPACSRRYGLEGRMHTVRTGDTLSSVAARYRVEGGWRALYRANRETLGRRPDRLRPGTLLVIPAEAARGQDRVPAVSGPPPPPPNGTATRPSPR
ncbi:transglycosylase family protein [Streptomyces sp. bgisy153]|uniref:transglycosylase family protein n=1 Tax=Streptomyces sp. bgisy153 TaxID=3413793 RepID=UPI003D7108B6